MSSLLDLFSLISNWAKKKRVLNLLMKALVLGTCYVCILWQTVVCFQKYFSDPHGVELKMVDTKDVPISLSFCKVVQDHRENVDGLLFEQQLIQLKEIYVNTESGTTVLHSTTETVTYDFIVALDVPFLCKEYRLPATTISSVVVRHDAGQAKNKNFHLFLHPSGKFLASEYLLRYSNTYFHAQVDGVSKLRFDTYDLTSSPNIACKNVDFDACKTLKIIQDYNNSFGCSYPVQR